ncbi:ABC transporter [Rhizoctonia solani]|uniref:histidinol-phosphatase n=1 Tax=Rhizoctonia solani TaxID=456999 RepID=A0A8H7IAR6_9AGAM|nr:ABC transporter [Rhizoctonia solani]
MKASHHSHSGQFCKHAVGTLEEVVKAAIERDFMVFGLTEHVPRYRVEDLYPEELEAKITPLELSRTFDDFVAEAHRLKELYLRESPCSRPRRPNRYVIGSVHHCNGIPIDFDKPTFERAVASFADSYESIAEMQESTPNHTQIAFLNSYLDAQFRLMERISPEVIGHFDLCRLYMPNLSLDPVWEKVARNVRYAVEYGAAFELNAAAFRKGWNGAYPGRDIIKLIQSMDGYFVLSDDSHGPTAVGLNYEKLDAFISEMHISKIGVLKKGKNRNRAGRFVEPGNHATPGPFPSPRIVRLPGLLFPKWFPPSSSRRKPGANLRQFSLAKPEREDAIYCLWIDFFSNGAHPDMLPISVTPATAGVALLALFTVGAVANAGRVVLMRSASARIVARLRKATYASALRQDVEFLERSAGPGDVVSRLNADAYIVGDSLTGNLSDGVRAIVTASIDVSLSLMFYLSPMLTALMLAIVPPVSLGAFAYGRYLKKLSNRTQEGLGDMTKVASEALSAVRTVQAFTAAPREEIRFASKVNHVQDLAIKEARAAAMFFGATGWSGNVVVLGLLAYGGSLVSRGQISVGDLTSLLMYTAYVGGSLSMLSSFFVRPPTAMCFIFYPVVAVISYERPWCIGADYGNIEFKNVSFAYPSRPGAEILRGFSMNIKGKGDSVAIVGKSGSGRVAYRACYSDSMIRTLARFCCSDIHDYSVESWRSAIAIVPQDPVLFTGTIGENIAYGHPSASRSEIEEAARLANCDFVWEMPEI